MSGKNSNIVKSVGVAGQPVADRVGCAETFEDRIQCAVGAAARRQVSAPGCASQLVENRGALRDIIRVAHVNAVNLDFAGGRGLDRVGERVAADCVFAIREQDENFLSIRFAAMREELGGEDDGVEERSQPIGMRGREAVRGAGSAAISGANQGWLLALKREDENVLVGHTCGFGNYFKEDRKS